MIFGERRNPETIPRVESVSVAGFELSRRTIVGPGFVVLNDHVHPNRQPGLFDISALARNQAYPTKCKLWCKVRWEKWNTSRRRTDIRARRIVTTLDKAEVK